MKRSPELPLHQSRAEEAEGGGAAARTDELFGQSRVRRKNDDGGGDGRGGQGLMMSSCGDVQGRVFILLWTPEETINQYNNQY